MVGKGPTQDYMNITKHCLKKTCQTPLKPSRRIIVSTALAPPVFGVLIDVGWSAEHLAWASFGYAVIGVGLIAVAMRRPG